MCFVHHYSERMFKVISSKVIVYWYHRSIYMYSRIFINMVNHEKYRLKNWIQKCVFKLRNTKATMFPSVGLQGRAVQQWVWRNRIRPSMWKPTGNTEIQNVVQDNRYFFQFNLDTDSRTYLFSSLHEYKIKNR